VSRHAPSAAPQELLKSIWKNRQLILQMSKREVIGRYRGSIMGLAWSLFNPILMLAVYTFVFSEVFKAKWGGGDGGKSEFAIMLFVGMIIHGFFAECANRAPSLVLQNSNYVTKVVFPLEILPISSLLCALFHTAISLVVLVGAQLLTQGNLPLSAVYFPLVLLPLFIGTLGISWILAAIGVFIRDVGQIIGVLTTVLLFLSPVLYPVSSLPPQYQSFLHLNPLTYIIEEGRNTLLLGLPLQPIPWLLAMAIACGLIIAGFWLFQKTRRGFADVI
jgi:lipopolysaccharide transport system permease protein